MSERRVAYPVLFAAVAAIYGALFFVATQGVLSRRPHVIGSAMLFDLVVTVPLLVWAIGVRRGVIDRRVPIALIGVGLFVASWLVPAGVRETLPILRGAFVLGELVVVVMLARKAGDLRRGYRALRAQHVAPSVALEQLLRPILGGLVARLVASELTTIGFALALGRSTPREDARTFAMHRRNHYGALVGVVLFLLAVESTLLHVVVLRWSTPAAWLATASSVWLALLLLGDANAVRLQPLRLAAEGLHVAVGVRWSMVIPYDAIATVGTADGSTPRSPTTLRATVGGAPTIALRLSRPLEARGLFGRVRQFETLLLTVDRPEELIAASMAASTTNGRAR